MCVPGAMAATSAAMVIRNPADAARKPAGPTNTATGVFAAMIALLMSRVESSSPPGVCSVKTISAAPSASALAIAERMNSELTGWMMPSTVAVSTIGARSADAAAAVTAAATHNVARNGFMSASGFLQQRFGLVGIRIHRQRFLRLRPRRRHVLEGKVGFAERDMRRDGVLAPQ